MSSVVFIDARVQDWEQLVSGFTADDMQVVVLDPVQDGIAQIAQALEGMTALDAIHIISHGSEGTLYLGDTVLTSDNLDQYKSKLADIGESLTHDGDILLFGCEVAKGATGLYFIEKLDSYSSAEVAASVDITGGAAVGGNWVLEASTGVIESVAPLNTKVQSDYSHTLAVGTVGSTSTPDLLNATLVQQMASLSEAAYGRNGIHVNQAINLANTQNGLGATTNAWSLVSGASLGLADSVDAQGYYYRFSLLYGTAQGFVAVTSDNVAGQNGGTKSMVISFRGTEFDSVTDFVLDWVNNILSVEAHALLFYDLVDSALLYAVDHGITNIYFTGHSLGATVAEHMMHYRADLSGINFQGVVFGSPGRPSDPDIGFDSRVLSFAHTDDPVANIDSIDWGTDADRHLIEIPPDNFNIGFEHPMEHYLTSVGVITRSELYPYLTDTHNLVRLPDASGAWQLNAQSFVVGIGARRDTVNGSAYDDLIDGGIGYDSLSGGGGNDRLAGGDNDDILRGGDGNDTLKGGADNDVIDGGTNGTAGDVAIFSNAQSDYDITRSGNSILVHAKNSGLDGDDALTGIEYLEFAGGAPVSVDSLPGPPATTTTVAPVTTNVDQIVSQISKYQSASADNVGVDKFVFDPKYFNLGSSLGFGTGSTLNFLKDYVTVSSAGAAGIKFVAADLYVQLSGFEQFQVKGWDTVTLAQVNGLIDGTLLADDHGSTNANATLLTATPVTTSAVISGTIGSSNDIDRFSVQLTAGHKYAFNGSAWNSSLDPFLALHSADGTAVAANNNLGPGISNAFLVYTPATSGTYYLDIFGFNFTTGKYLVAHSDISGSSTAETLVATPQPADPASPSSWTWEGTSGGDDYEWSSTGPARLRGHNGNDDITGGNGSGNHDVIWGDDGNDSLRGAGGPDTILGGSGDDFIDGGENHDVLHGESGNDRIFGRNGNDYLHGHTGQDDLSGGDGNDYLKGGSEDDDLTGGNGNDELYGDEGNDEINGGDGDDIIKGGTGDDFQLDGDAGDDLIEGEAGNDTLIGGDGNDILRGGQDSDSLNGGPGNNVLDGGVGEDWVDYSQGLGSFSGVAINLFDGKAVTFKDLTGDPVFDALYTPDDRYDTLISIENVRGGSRNDRIDGDHSNNIIYGNQGDDVIRGHNGVDSIDGGGNNDVLWGDEGNDTVSGGTGNDEVRGGLGNDILAGNDGDDELRGEQSNDMLDGGAGNDVAFFWGERDDFAVTLNGDGSYTVADIRPVDQEGVDNVRNVEVFRFFSGDVSVAEILSTAPVANDDAVITDSATAIVVDALSNDVDGEGNPLALVVLNGNFNGATAYIASGKVVVDPNGAFDYLNPGESAQVVVGYSISDGTGWADSAVITLTITSNDIANAGAHAPDGADKSVTLLEEASYTFSAADFGFSDPNDNPANALTAVKIATLPGAGTFTLSGVAVSAGQTIAVANIPNLSFTPAGNANGTNYTSFTFQVQDNGGTLDGGVDLDPTPNAITLNVTAVNDAPAGTNKSITLLEDASYTFAASDFGFNDVNDIPANTLNAVKIATLPVAGTLTLSGGAVSVGQTIAAASIPNLSFTPADNANGTTYASFTFQVQDNGGTFNGGADLDPTPNTITLNVTAVNDAPVNTVPGARSGTEDTAVIFTGASAITVADIDNATFTTTLSIANGILTLGGTAGVTVNGNGTGTVQLTGAAGAINTALNGTSFNPTADYNGATTLTVTTTDGTITDIDTVGVTLAAVADIANDTANTPLNTAVIISVLGNDSFENTGRTITAVNGSAITAGGAALAVTNGMVGLNASDQLIFTPATSFTGAVPTFTYTVTSGGVTETANVNVTVNAAVAGLVSIGDVTTITEGDSGSTISTFTVTRSGGTLAFAVNYASANGTATAGNDYVATSNTLNFGTGVNTQTIAVTINGDTMNESHETFFINLSGATNGAIISDSQGQGTIINDDAAPASSEGSDVVTLTQFSGPWHGFGGNDAITGSIGVDIIYGDDGNDSLVGGAGNDRLFGGEGNDWLEGETGNDPFVGVAGNDELHGDNGDDIILGGGGDDLVYGGSGTDFLIGETGGDLMYGGSEWDAIDGRQGSDVLYGEGGDDIIFGDGYFYLFGFANDSLFGGDGNDIMMGEAGENSTSGSGDAIYGENGNDLLDGGAGDDAIYGGAGNDVIDGDNGNDYIVGGQGAEIMLGSNAVLYGGPTQGSDLFVYQAMTDAGDSIYGFDTRPGETDGIDLRPLFDALGYAGATPRAVGTNILQVMQSGADTLVQIDPDGAPGAQGYTTLVTLVGVTAATVTDSFFLFQ